MTRTLEQAQFYTVANLGPRPHNLPADDVLRLLAEGAGQEHTMLSFKPRCYPTHPRDGRPIQRHIEGMLSAAQLDVVCTAESSLSGEEVCELYRNVLPPDEEDDAKFGTGWKVDLIKYMTSDSLFTQLIRGKDAFRRTRTIKSYVRKHYTYDDISKVVENVGHTPDPEDFDISLQILMLGGLAASRTLEDSRRR